MAENHTAGSSLLSTAHDLLFFAIGTDDRGFDFVGEGYVLVRVASVTVCRPFAFEEEGDLVGDESRPEVVKLVLTELASHPEDKEYESSSDGVSG